MAGINQTLFTAKEALLANLTAINVTGANIANVNTSGYSRLRPIFESSGTTNISSTTDQAGVKIADIQRVYDGYLEAQIVDSTANVGNYSAQNDMLSYIEGILNETSATGVNDALSQFWNSWSTLANNPANDSARNSVISRAENLANIISQRYDSLETLQDNANASVSDTTDTLNRYLSDMASLNNAIVQTESAGGNTSSLRDTRGELLNKISEIINVEYMEKSDGSLYIYLPSNGSTLIEGGNARLLEVQKNSENNNLYDLVFQENSSQVLNDDITGGKLAALFTIRDEVLPSYLDYLDQTATSIINKVNEQHQQGYDQSGNPGIAFFNETTTAKEMSVNSVILTDSSRIAASSTVNNDGNNATMIAALQNDPMYANVTNVSLSDPSTSAVGQINEVGQVYKETLSGYPITLTRGATSSASDWSVTDNGGYSSLTILDATNDSITLDLNGNGQASVTFTLSGSWSNGDTLSFSFVKNSGTSTIGSYYSNFIAKVGQDVNNAAQFLESSNTIANQLANQRETYSGVSLDEEMMNLIKYQMAYNASGRMTQAVSEIMDILLGLGQ